MLTNSERLKIIAEAKRSGYKGSYLDLLKKHEEGGFSDAGMTGMMKAKIAMENQFGNNPAISRMISPPDESYDFGDGRTGTHDMGSYGKFAIPNIQDVDGTLQYTGPRKDEAIKFDRMDDATYFAENYKDVAPALKEKRAGGFANLPDPDSKPTMSQSLQRFMKQEHMPPMKNFEEGGMKDSDSQQYQVEVIKYPLGYKNMPPGHIESRILNVDDLPEEYGNVSKQLNPWPEGNRRVYYSPERNYAPGVETTVLNLNKKDLETYLDAAQKGDYNFLSNNCADQTCAAFGLDQSKYTALGVTTPQQVFDALKNDPRAVKESTTGDATTVEDSLKAVNEVINTSIPARLARAGVNLAKKSAEEFKKAAAKYDKTIAESKASARNRMEEGGLSSDSDSTIVQKNDPLVNAVQTAARSEDELRFDDKGIAYDIKTGERFGGNIIREEDSTSDSLEGKIGLQHSPYGRSSSGKTDPNNLYYTNYTTGKVYTKAEYKKLLNNYKVLYNKTRKETE